MTFENGPVVKKMQTVSQKLSGAGARENDWLGGLTKLRCHIRPILSVPERRDRNEVHRGHKIPVFEKSQMSVGGERQQP